MPSAMTKTLFLREIWEHKRLVVNNFFYASAGLLCLLLLSLHKITQRVSTHTDFHLSIDGNLTDATQFNLSLLSAGFVTLISLLAFCSSVFYLLNCLYDDRKDRSILFWKSLPIPELHSVGTKFFVGVLAIPLFAMTIASFALIIHALVLSTWVSWSTPFSFVQVWSGLQIPGVIGHKFTAATLFSIWTMPLFAWCLFCSAFSKKSPVFLAIAPPVLIIATEKILFGTSTLLALWKTYYPDLSSLLYTKTSISEMLSFHVAHLIQGPQFIFGAFITAGFIYASVWLRNNRYEI